MCIRYKDDILTSTPVPTVDTTADVHRLENQQFQPVEDCRRAFRPD